MIRPEKAYRATGDAVLLAAAVSARAKETVLDAGVGTGAVTLCLNARIKGLSLTGIDIQPEMTALFEQNARLNGLTDLRAVTGDIADKNNGLSRGAFDCVVTNPPYADETCASPDPIKDTAHRERFLSLSEWTDACLKYLRPQGRFYMIHRADRLPEIMAVLNGKLGGITLLPVFTKPSSPAKRIILSGKKNSKTPAKILSGLVLNDENGHPTPQAEEILRHGKAFAKSPLNAAGFGI